MMVIIRKRQLERKGGYSQPSLLPARNRLTSCRRRHGPSYIITSHLIRTALADLEPPSDAGHILRKLGAELFEQAALLGFDLVLSHVCDEGRQEQCCASI